MYENQTLMTRTQVAEYMACSVDTVDRFAAEGILTKRYLRPAKYLDTGAPNYMMGTMPRFRKDEVDALIEKRFKE